MGSQSGEATDVLDKFELRGGSKHYNLSKKTQWTRNKIDTCLAWFRYQKIYGSYGGKGEQDGDAKEGCIGFGLVEVEHLYFILLVVLLFETFNTSFLELFGELKEQNESYRYAKVPSFVSWKRFERVYQNRIRIITLDNPDTAYRRALSTLSQMRGEGPLLPKLHTLRWYGLSGLGLIEPSVMFMHSSIREFVIDQMVYEVEDLEPGIFASYCATISARMPFLSCLQIGVYPSQVYEKPIVALMKQLPNLRELLVPPFPDLTQISRGLAEVPQMEIFIISTNFSHLPSSILKHSNPPECVDLRKLQQMVLYCTYVFSTRLLQNISPTAEMRSLTMDSHDPETSDNIRILILQIATKFSHLTLLHLDHKPLVYGRGRILDTLLSRPLAKDIIHFKHLIPILSGCPKIILFNLQSPYPPAIDDHDIETIAKSWPGLEEFSFCHQPVVLLLKREKRMTLKALSHFSLHCPNLSTLKLYLDATSDHIPDVISGEARRLEKLSMLDVGPSPIDENARVAYTLAHFCSTQTKLSFGNPWGYSDRIDPRINSTWRPEWKAVEAALLPKIEKQISPAEGPENEGTVITRSV
ncbi:hypothetical protein BDP27DRAFT_1365700 [Rhodocollybia butyracea]|uniref:Uncharacterized protein n=1 Tax=Rhodocollybia butyracea TaxID=206335 RepID=A0A9P5PN10_9AGAR|nr:hypothetical protein BDP27DRAFT_1365700 [Rhodocollybia butyracea]